MKGGMPWWLWLALLIEFAMITFLAAVVVMCGMLFFYAFQSRSWMALYWLVLFILGAAHTYKMVTSSVLKDWERNE